MNWVSTMPSVGVGKSAIGKCSFKDVADQVTSQGSGWPAIVRRHPHVRHEGCNDMGSDADPRQLLSEGRIYPAATLPLAVASGVRGLDAGVVIGVSPIVCVFCCYCGGAGWAGPAVSGGWAAAR